MVNPKTGYMTREWVVESLSAVFASGDKVALSSAKHPVVSEAYQLNAFTAGGGTVAPAQCGTVIAHDVSFPTLGTVGATQAATLGPQQFIVAGFVAGAATQLNGLFLIRGR